jgi:hypothetical protein
MSIGRSLGWAGAVALLSVSFGGCVSTAGGDGQGARVSDNFEVYAPFDNERDWGPSYLIGPPAHNTADEETLRAADPTKPPLSAQPTELSPPLP